MDLNLPVSNAFYWVDLGCASVLALFGAFYSFKKRSRNLQLMRQLERAKKRSDQLANFIIPIGISLMSESNFSALLEKILQEGKSLAHADGGSLYLVTPEKTLRFAIVLNDSLKIAMGGTFPQPVTLPPLNLFLPESGEPNLKNIATSCALSAQSIAVPDVYATGCFDFTGTKAFDQRMNYRTISVMCIPLTDAKEGVMGVLQLINAQDAETGRVIPFDDHLAHLIGLLGRLAAAALRSNLRVEKLTAELDSLRIKIDEGKKTRQVAEITGSDYFKNLQAQAREMRSKVKGQEKS